MKVQRPKSISEILKYSIISGLLIGVTLTTQINILSIPSLHLNSAHAFTNTFTGIALNTCASCSNPITISDKASNIGDLIVFETICSTNFAVSSITDTISNSWSNTGTSQSYTITNSQILSTHTGSTQFYIFVWFTKALSTSVSTATVTFNSAPSYCEYQTLDGNTQFTAFNNDFIGSPQYQAVTPQAQANYVNYAPIANVPANSIVLTISSSVAACDNSLPANCALSQLAFPANSLIQQQDIISPLSDGTCSGTNCYLISATGSFQSNSQVQLGLGFQFPYQGNNFHSGSQMSQQVIGYIFNIQGTISTSGVSQVQVGCSSTSTPTIATPSYAVKGNVTYWTPITTSIGIGSGYWSSPLNVTMWVSSVGSRTTIYTGAIDIYVLLWTQSGTFSPNNQPSLPSSTTPWYPSLYWPTQNSWSLIVGQTQLIAATHYFQTTKPFKISAPVDLNIPAGQMYAIGLYVTHNGVNIVNCPNSTGQFYQQPISNTVILNSGADISFCNSASFCSGGLTSAVTNSTTPYLYALVNTPGVNIVQTQTSIVSTQTSYSTVTSISTTGIATTTVTTTVTSNIITNAFQSPTGSTQIMYNLVTYLPLWLLPLMFGSLGAAMGFGTGGLLMGLMMGLMLSQLDGQMPLWTVFIDVIMIYVLLRR